MSIKTAIAYNENKVAIPIELAEKHKTYKCYDCGEDLIPKLGKKKAHHYAHKSDSRCTGESWQHIYCKSLITRYYTNMQFLINCKKCSHKSTEIITSDFKPEEEKSCGKYKLDVGFTNKGIITHAIEIFHTHVTEEEKHKYLLQNSIKMLEIKTSEILKQRDAIIYNRVPVFIACHIDKWCDNCDYVLYSFGKYTFPVYRYSYLMKTKNNDNTVTYSAGLCVYEFQIPSNVFYRVPLFARTYNPNFYEYVIKSINFTCDANEAEMKQNEHNFVIRLMRMNGEKLFPDPVSSMLKSHEELLQKEFSEPMNLLIKWVENGLEGYKSYAINCVINRKNCLGTDSPWEKYGNKYLEFAGKTFGYQSDQMTEYNMKNDYDNYGVPIPYDVISKIKVNADILADFRGKLNKTQDKSDLSVFTSYGSFHILLNKRLSRASELTAHISGINIIYLTDNWVKINRNLEPVEACNLLLFLAKNNREICVRYEPVGLGGNYRDSKKYGLSADDEDSEYGNIQMEMGRYTFPGRIMRTENEVSKMLVEIITNLRINGADRKHIPNAVRMFKNLTSLSVTNCKLLYVPNYMFAMDSITMLNFSSNEFTCIPEVICYVKNLQSLNMSNNAISKVTSRIGNLQNLSVLLLANNLITELPREIASLKLETLDLSNNPMKGMLFKHANSPT